jgi:hypothetical protein
MSKYIQFSTILLILVTSASCRWGKSKHKFYLENSFIVEFYRAGLIGNMTSIYVIDSLSHKHYIGTYNPGSEFIHVYLKGDSLVAEKMESYPAEHKKKLINRDSFFIKNGIIIN